MNVVVTGGAGFIGRALCRRLAPEHDVLVLDNHAIGRPATPVEGVRYERVDLTAIPSDDLVSLLGDFGADAVVHLAALHFIPFCMENPDLTFQVNTAATERVVRAAVAAGCRRVVFASTADVYEAADQLHREADRPTPSNIYGLTKALGERIVEYGSFVSDDLSSVVLRLANVYGPGETNAHFIPDVLRRLNDGQPHLRLGWLGSERDFVFVDDVADAFATAAGADVRGHNVFNVGTGVSTPTREVLRLLMAAAGDERKVEEDEARFRRFDRRTLSVDVSEAARVLGWRAAVGLEDGLAALLHDPQLRTP